MRWLLPLFLLTACGSSDGSRPPPIPQPISAWTAGPTIDGKNYSLGTVISGNVLTIPAAPNSIHYVTKPVSGLSGTGISLRYRIDGEGQIIGANCPASNPSQLYLYFQREGDDWSGTGKKETYRWWASFAPGDLTPGEHSIDAPFSAHWTAIETSNNATSAAAFQDALRHASKVGFTFSNCTGLGHGAWAVGGPATLTILEFKGA